MDREMAETGVVHGRFQVVHNDHMKYILAAKERCKYLIVGITNPDPTLTKRDEADPARSAPEANLLTYLERQEMLRAALLEAGLRPDEFAIVPFPINFPELYDYYVPLDAVFYLTIYDKWGERKLEMFRKLELETDVMWRRPAAEKGITSTEVRRLIAAGRPWEHLVPASVAGILKQGNIINRIMDAWKT
jgi:nicotinamide mononucleotide adenylyltransferase